MKFASNLTLLTRKIASTWKLLSLSVTKFDKLRQWITICSRAKHSKVKGHLIDPAWNAAWASTERDSCVTRGEVHFMDWADEVCSWYNSNVHQKMAEQFNRMVRKSRHFIFQLFNELIPRTIELNNLRELFVRTVELGRINATSLFLS